MSNKLWLTKIFFTRKREVYVLVCSALFGIPSIAAAQAATGVQLICKQPTVQ